MHIKIKKLFLLISLSLAAVPSFCFAGDKKNLSLFTVDPVHSRISFEVTHLAFSTVEGWFRSFSGTFKFNKESLEVSDLNATAEANSIFTDNEKRDNHLKSTDFLDTKNFPNITFKSTAMKKIDAKNFKLTGDFTMKNVTKKVTFNVKYKGSQIAFDQEKVAFEGTTKISRKEFGLNFSVLEQAVPLVGDEITIKVVVQGIKNK
ncbi:MAG: YceI family protein [Silvanigrellaceae bacterium]|nr:YceI family protein [Silvanigrellaceae bacterium]